MAIHYIEIERILVQSKERARKLYQAEKTSRSIKKD